MAIDERIVTLDIPHHFTCRPYQKPFFQAMKGGCKRAVLVWHRRAGKEKTCWNYLIMQACRRIGTYFYFFPTFAQGRKVLWDFIDKDGFKVLEHIPKEMIEGKPNGSEMKIRLKNGSLIQIVGTNNFDSIVGTNPIGCVFSEYSLQDPRAWTLIRPILVENNGWAVFNFTPRGQNHAKELYEMAKINPEWFCQLLTVDDTTREDGSRIITDKDIEAERKAGMSEDYIQQEFYCSFTLGVEGAYYAKYLWQAREEGRLCPIVYNKQARVHTAWDIGIGDSTAIVFFQYAGQEIHILDYYENSGEGLPHYAFVIEKKPYLYGDHFAPHDIANRNFSSGLSTQEVAADLGIKFRILPTLKLSIESGIEAARGIFPRVWIEHVKARKLIHALENYRKEFDVKNNVYRTRPLHDWSSHGADAFRYMSLAVKLYADSRSGPSDDEVERLRNIYQPRFDS